MPKAGRDELGGGADSILVGERPLGSGATSVALWGGSPSVVSVVLHALASRIDPNYILLDTRPAIPDSTVERFLARDRARHRVETQALDPDQLLPLDPMEREIFARLLRVDSNPVEVARLAEFVTLPRILQQIVGGRVPRKGPRVVAVLASDRLTDSYAHRFGELEMGIRALRTASVSLLTGRTGAPSLVRKVYDWGLEVECSTLEHWTEGSLEVEHAPSEFSMIVGRSFRLERIPWASPVLAAARKVLTRGAAGGLSRAILSPSEPEPRQGRRPNGNPPTPKKRGGTK